MLNDFVAQHDIQDRERELIWKLENRRFAEDGLRARRNTPVLAGVRALLAGLLHHRLPTHHVAAH